MALSEGNEKMVRQALYLTEADEIPSEIEVAVEKAEKAYNRMGSVNLPPVAIAGIVGVCSMLVQPEAEAEKKPGKTKKE